MLKQKFETNEDVVGAWLSIGHPTVAEVTAGQRFDFVVIDTEHTPIGLETVENMCRGVDAADTDTSLLVRVPSNDPVRIKRVLDIGVDGVMVPMVETASEARQVVDATRYPPEGSRGVASGRAAEYGDGFKQYVDTANESIFTLVQIETRTGLDNAEAIASVDGIDAVFVGPADLSANLDIFAEWENNRLDEAIERVIDAGASADVPVGTLVVNPEDIQMRVAQGFDFLIIGKDTNHLSSSNQRILQTFEEAVSSRVSSPASKDGTSPSKD